MSEYIKLDDTQVKKLFENLASFQLELPRLLLRMAFLIKSSITDRVQRRGMGVNKALSKYSIMTKSIRKAAGRQVAYKDLTFTGRMFNSMSVSGGSTRAIVFFGSKDEERKALAQEERGDNFFGIGKEEDIVIDQQLQEAMAKL